MPLIDPSDPTGRIDTIRTALADPGRFVARPFGDFQFLDWQAMAVERALGAPALPDPDADLKDAIAAALPNGEWTPDVVLNNLRANGFDVVRREDGAR